MNLKLYLDDALVPDSDIADLTDITITKQERTADGSNANGFSSGITLYGATAADILNRLVYNNPPEESIPFRIEDDCCDVPEVMVAGALQADGLSWCEGCEEVAVTLIEQTALNCLQTAYIFEGDISTKPHPFVRYCVELRPSFVHDLLIALGFVVVVNLFPILFVVGAILTMLNIIISVINLIIAAVNTLPLVDIDEIGLIGGDINGFDNAFDLVQPLIEYLIGCRRGHPAPFIRDYATNGCQLCGLAFSSSVWNDAAANPDLFRAVQLWAPAKKGAEAYTNWIDENKPLLTISAFLDDLATICNGEWWLEGSTLRLETKEFRRNLAGAVVITAKDIKARNGESICYEFDAEGIPGWLEINTAKDTIDWVGEEGRRLYRDLLEFRNPPNARYKGSRKVELPYAPSRFRNDGIERDVLTFWGNLLGNPAFQFLASLPPPFGSLFDGLFGGFFGINTIYDRALLLPTDTCTEPKYLVLEPGYDINNARVMNQELGGQRYYNWPFWSSAADTQYTQKQLGFGPNLYRFFASDDPRITAKKGVNYTVTLLTTCERRAELYPGRLVVLPAGRGVVREVQIDDSFITISGTL